MNDARQAVFSALADPTRRQIFEWLSSGEADVSQLTAEAQVSQPAVSQHLAVLRNAGLVRMRQEGRHRYYRADPSGLAPVVDWFSHHQSFWRQRLTQLKHVLEETE